MCQPVAYAKRSYDIYLACIKRPPLVLYIECITLSGKVDIAHISVQNNYEGVFVWCLQWSEDKLAFAILPFLKMTIRLIMTTHALRCTPPLRLITLRMHLYSWDG
jgi:hypothetical protein